MTESISNCPWCNRDFSEFKQVIPKQIEYQYAICEICAQKLGDVPEVDLNDLPREFVDNLPFGSIVLSSTGIILRYNRREEEYTGFKAADVEGKHFFREVAPCTAVKQFEGKFKQMIEGGVDDQIDFEFIFNLPNQKTHVKIVMTFFSASKIITLLIIKVKEEL